MVEYYDLNETQYLFFSQQVTWDEARVLCSYYNAKLAILDTLEKATKVAELIADSNIEIEEDSWLGGRRLGNTWSWMYDRVGSRKNSEIPVQPNIEDYPPWAREPSRPMKNCLAIDRRAHSHPNFIDLDCRLQRSFICERRPEEGVGKPIPSKWVQIQRHTYTFYHAKFTWEEAAVYCRLLGARLAILSNSDVIEILANIMTKARPNFETVWIGAHYTYGQWIWLSTGTSLEPATDENGYPPWQSGRSERNDGCLLFDRHMDNTPSFIETRCDRKRDFICEEYPKDELNDWLNEPTKFTYNDSIYVIYPMEKTWEESNAFCNEQGSVLAHINDINITNLIVEAMGDHPKDISHIWIGGNLIKKDEWQWTQSGRRIANRKDSFGFPPWTNMNDEQLDRYTGHASTCLNLDRSDHVRPHFYGLDCDSKQPFVCKITCNVTPPVNNGSWICEDTPKGKRCELRCDDGFMTMGIRKIFCTHQHGWITVKNWLEVPLCIVSKDYAKRMVRSLDHDLQRSAGYFFIVDHANEKMQSLSLRFTEQILNIFPMNYNLKMGMYSMNPPIQLSFNQTDTCAALQMINSVTKKSNAVDNSRQLHSNTWNKQLSVHKGRKIVIFIIIDANYMSHYLEILAHMKTIGNRIVAIGLEDNWEFLLALASIGFDRRKNLYLFNDGNLTEFDTIIKELHSFKKKTLQCPKRETDLINIHSEKKNSTTIHHTTSSGFDQNQDKSQEQVTSEKENLKDQGLESEKESSSKDNDSTNDTITAEDEDLKIP
ncbi:C-type mannose receptor 2 [Formica fusca]